MAQTRVHLASWTEHTEDLEILGFRYCKKDGRFEVNRLLKPSELKYLASFLPPRVVVSMKTRDGQEQITLSEKLNDDEVAKGPQSPNN
jgi:hypothetical protein